MQELPPDVKNLFWGDNLSDLSWDKHAHYITQTILDRGGLSALSWLFHQVNPSQIKKELNNYKLSAKSKNFWGLYLA